MDRFVHLHNHSHFSLMDGLNTPEELVDVAKDFGQPAMSITDHGTLAGHRDMQIACKEAGVKPILGLEAYISETDRFDRRPVKNRDDNTTLYKHLILLAKDEAGLKNLHHLSREAWESGYYYKPRIDFELLDEYGDGLIVLSGCLNGLLTKPLEDGNMDEAVEWAKKFHGRFAGDFYIEVQAHNPAEINEGLLKIADEHGISPVATADCHFARPELRWIEEAMLILSTARRLNKSESYATTHKLDIFDRYNALYPDRPISFQDLDLYVMSRKEIYEAFIEQTNREDIFENTLDIEDKVDEYEFVKDQDFLPNIDVNPDKLLENKVMQGLKERGVNTDEYINRAKKELKVINGKNFSRYFLVVEDIVSWAKASGIRVGPGRGSAAGSLVCYALGITDVDPIRWGLLFFRFIDESREDWPDIDVDFQKSRRGEVKEYIHERFGHVASISNFIYFKDKGVVRDAARVFAVPLHEVNKVAKAIDDWDDFVTSKLEQVVEFRNKYPEVVELGEGLRGRIKSMGLHAGGIVTSNQPIEDYAPIETRDDPDDKRTGRIPVVALDMRHCEAIGLIKLDILGLTELDIIDDAIRMIRERHGIDYDKEEIPLDDKLVYKELSKGHTTGVFQAHEYAYTSLLKEMGVRDIHDFIASNALVRPGARNTVGEIFIRRMHGDEPVRYIHHRIEPYLQDTYGTIVFQEQVMLAATQLGGLSEAEANKMRKIIGKKRDASEFDVFREKFVEGASEHIDRGSAEELWSNFEEHAGYSFNKSHSVAYTLLAYQTAWLKLHYPLEYMTAVLRHEEKKESKTDALMEAKRLGLDILLPHINKSGERAQIDGNKIRLGLADIKYISDAVYRNLNQYRPFKTFDELLAAHKTVGSGINVNVVAALQKVGATRGLKGDDSKYDADEYLYEYLNIPKFKSAELPDKVMKSLTPLDEYEETGAYAMKGMVNNIKRGDTWVIIEFIGETGKASAFHKPGTEIQEGQMYLFLVANNTIVEYVPVDEFGKGSNFERFLLSDGPKIRGDEAVVVAFSQRFTKARKPMGTAVLCNKDKELRGAFLFPRQFGQHIGQMTPGNVIKPHLKQLDDGAHMIVRLL